MKRRIFIDDSAIALLYDAHAVMAGMLMALEGDPRFDLTEERDNLQKQFDLISQWVEIQFANSN